MNQSVNLLSLIFSCLSFAILISFGITYVKFLNLNPVLYTDIIFDDRKSASTLTIAKSDVCNITRVYLLTENNAIPVTQYTQTSHSTTVPIIIGDVGSEINIVVEYSCSIGWLHREGDTLIAHALTND